MKYIQVRTLQSECICFDSISDISELEDYFGSNFLLKCSKISFGKPEEDFLIRLYVDDDETPVKLRGFNGMIGDEPDFIVPENEFMNFLNNQSCLPSSGTHFFEEISKNF